MIKFIENNFYKTSDKKQIFYQANFKPTSFDPENDYVLVFNYGLVCSSLHWKYQFDYFDKLGFKILTHDYRGHFQSTGIEDIEKITFKQIAQDLNELLTHLKIKKPIFLAHSMGVNVTLEYDRQYPGHAKGLVLISGTTLPVKDIMFDTNLMEFVMPMGSYLLKNFKTPFQKIWKTSGWNPIIVEFIRRSGFNAKKVGREFVEIYMNRVGELGVDLFFQLFKQMSVHDILGYCRSIKCHTLIIGGDKDGVIPNYLQRILHSAIIDSEFYLVKDGSHVVQVDFPDHINERIGLFLKKKFIKQ